MPSAYCQSRPGRVLHALTGLAIGALAVASAPVARAQGQDGLFLTPTLTPVQGTVQTPRRLGVPGAPQVNALGCAVRPVTVDGVGPWFEVAQQNAIARWRSEVSRTHGDSYAEIRNSRRGHASAWCRRVPDPRRGEVAMCRLTAVPCIREQTAGMLGHVDWHIPPDQSGNLR
ncbi:MAG: hypothetical protein JJU19_08825 [Pararhodobacter sp.]|nr:hypothetical protein [Pararhodobacter sp.]